MNNVILCPLLLTTCVYSLKKRKLSLSGAFVALIAGYIIGNVSGRVYLVLTLVFFLCNYATRCGFRLKKAIDKKYSEDGYRNYKQVLANVGVSSSIGMTYLIFKDPEYHSIVERTMIYSLLALLGDTIAGEIGILSTAKPVYILNIGTTVKKGENGGVSLLGYLAAFFASTFCAIFYSCLKLEFNSRLALLMIFSALFGTTIDSIIGQLFERKAFDDKNSNNYKLDNDQVNFISNGLTTVIMFFLDRINFP